MNKNEKLKVIAEKLSNALKGKYEIITESGCWIWMKGLSHSGYGVGYYKKTIRAHRMSYRAHNGNIPEGLIVRHTCDVPCCINPNHLIIGTNKENSEDMVKRGRATTGEKCGLSKLKEDAVREIFMATGKYRDIGKLYDVDNTLVSLIKNRRIWKDTTRNLINPPKGVRPCYNKMSVLQAKAKQ